MSVKTQILLIGIACFVLVCIIACLLERMDKAEKNINFLVDFINKEIKENKK